MMALLLPWWRDRSTREQWLIGAAAALFVAIMLWLGIARPLAAARAAAATRLATATTALAEVQAMTPAIRAAEARAPRSSDMPLIELVSQSAAAAGLTTEALAGSGDGLVSLRIAAVRPPALLAWLGALAQQQGVIAERIELKRNSDATIAADLVLRRGGR